MAKRFITVHADATDRKKVPPSYQRYKIQSIPQILFLDAKGRVLDKMRKRDAVSLAKQMEGIARNYSP